MKKQKLINLIEKGCLGTDEPNVIFKVTDEDLRIHNYVKKTGTCRVVTNFKDVKLEDMIVPVPDYKQLLNILKALDEDIELSLTKTSLHLSDSASDVQFGLGDPRVFEKIDYEVVRAVKPQPPVNCSFELNKEFIDRFQKSKAALGTNVVGINTSSENIEFTIGYSPTQNKNKIVLTRKR